MAGEKPVKKEHKPKANESAQTVETKSAKFPTEGKLSKYGFIYLDADVLAAWGLSKGSEQQLSIDLKEDDLVIRKVA